MPYDPDMWRFYQHHGARMFRVNERTMRADIPLVCFNYDGTGCTIYEQRPKICRTYLCDKARYGTFAKPRED
jgi:Fe-S-cluster containining protein